MSDEDTGPLAEIESELVRLMPTALDMVATVVDAPASDLDTYDGLLTVAEANSPLLLLAVIRVAAGMTVIAEMSGEQVRALAA